MKKCLLSALLCIFSFAAFCQQTDSIVIVKTFDNLTFLRDGQTHNLKDLPSLVASNPEAVKYADKARTDNTFAMIFSCAGGFMIGWTLGTYMGGGEPEWSFLAVGAGSLTVGMIFNSCTKKNARKAVEIYNGGVNMPTSNHIQSEIGVGLTGNGMGLSLRF